MANLYLNTGASSPWNLSVNQNGKITLKTSGTYLDRNIEINVPSASVTPGATNGDISGVNVTLEDTNSSGVSVSREAINYSLDNAGWINSLSGNAAKATKYITGVTLTKPSSGTRSFSVTVPEGSTTATFVFNVDSNGNVTVNGMNP